MKPKPVFGLVCTGGGAHGAYQVGVLKYIHERFSHQERSPFQIFTGCSCGSLNTSFYAAQALDARKSRLWLEELWMGFHIPSYHGNMLKNAFLLFCREKLRAKEDRHATWCLLDPKPMLNVIRNGFVRAHLEKAMAEKATLGIGVVATELVSGRCCWFLEGPHAISWNIFHSLAKVEKITVPHIAASCSVPIFMPPVRVGDRYFLDGSVNLDRPLSAAISMGATRILTIATDKPYPDELPSYSPSFRPRISNVIRMLLNRLSKDAATDEAIQIEAFNQFYHDLSRKNRRLEKGLDRLPLFHEEAMPSHYRPTEILQLHPSKRIKQTSVDAIYGHGEQVKRRHTRFMFHEKFIRELIHLGYEDAKAQHEKLTAFFLGDGVNGRRWFSFLKKGES
ncbi:MAG TPA: patatin-like phospholipase family protein [Verrucomicrobiae bacterium]|jgi:NTE family protein|nr:patatin-like phospholipase family protein [Verrucomicrobiae bacterium]